VASNQLAQLLQVFMTGQPLSQLMQGGLAPADGPLAQLAEAVTVT